MSLISRNQPGGEDYVSDCFASAAIIILRQAIAASLVGQDLTILDSGVSELGHCVYMGIVWGGMGM